MPLIIVMGVSGCGKSSMAAALAERLGLPFIEGDALHPPANIEKMSKGIALDDNDRWPWLERVGEALGATKATGGGVATCSSLKHAYRDVLRKSAGAVIHFVYLHGSRELLLQRMQTRLGHFMPASLLDSQLEALEPPGADENAIYIDCARPLADAVANVVRVLAISP